MQGISTIRSAVSVRQDAPSSGGLGWLLIGSAVWLLLATTALVLLVTWNGIRCPWLVAMYFAATVVGSIIAFTAYGIDKRRAVKGTWRISEKTLHWMAALGGWPGAMIARRVFRHKTQKLRFRVISWGIIAVHVPIALYSLLQVTIGG